MVLFGVELKRPIKIGILYSRSGTYSLISQACRRGVERAVADLNADAAAT
ncbi:MAG: N-acetylmuramoyl-L-alanine amidase, partial [Proteobacteria bacterium]